MRAGAPSPGRAAGRFPRAAALRPTARQRGSAACLPVAACRFRGAGGPPPAPCRHRAQARSCPRLPVPGRHSVPGTGRRAGRRGSPRGF